MNSSTTASGRSSRGSGTKTPSKNESNSNDFESEKEDLSIENIEDVDDEGEDDEEEVTRCVCTLTNPPDPDNQGYIQCDKCAVWQHQACVGISPEMGEELDKYWCEICKPELHSLYDLKVNRRQQNYSAEDSLKRSQYSTTPYNNTTSERRSRTPRKTYSNEELDKEEIDSNPDKKSTSKPLRKRNRVDASPSTRQSRNRSSAAEREELQYQNMLKKVLQESKKDAYRENEDHIDDNEINEYASDVKEEDLDAVKSEDNVEATPDREWRRSKRRRLASPRSEQVSTFSTDGYNAEEEPQLTPNTRQARKVTSSRNQAGSIDSMLDQDSETKKHPLNEEDEEHKEDIKKTETFEEEETASAEQKPKRTYNRRTTQNGTNSRPIEGSRRNVASKSKSKNNISELEINEAEDLQQSHMEKLLKLAQESSKPRQTPEGITVEEMYERVTAISAFLERSKEELMFLQKNQNVLLSFVENPEFIEEYKKNVDIDLLLKQMNSLNGDLGKFGKV